MGCARAIDDAEPVAVAHCHRCPRRRHLWRPLCAVSFRAAEVARDHGVDPARQVLQEPLRATSCPPERWPAEEFLARRAGNAIPPSGPSPLILASWPRHAAPT